MGRRVRILTQIFGFDGWNVKEAYFERADRTRVDTVLGRVPTEHRLVLRVERRWLPRCVECGGRCSGGEATEVRRWVDLPWGQHPVEVEAVPLRVRCKRCLTKAVEWLPWADRYQRQTRRLQQTVALEAASMPLMHVAAKHGLTWGIVRRAEQAALERWAATRKPIPLRMAGLDEKYLGRRNKFDEKYVSIASNLENGEPIWIGYGRSKKTVRRWLATLTNEQKAELELVAMDMHEPFKLAVQGDPKLQHVKVVHDVFHVMKRAAEAVNEIRKDTFFRAGKDMRAIGRGTRWLVLRAWENCSPAQRETLRCLFSFNRQLARAYQVVEELRAVLRGAPSRDTMETGLKRILRRTQSRGNKHLRKLHESLRSHWDEILAIGEHRPPSGRIEALNNNWETLVRRARGYRDHRYLLLKLRFMIANPIHTAAGVERFLALGLPAPMRRPGTRATS